MTDKDIIKALECCSILKCLDCPQIDNYGTCQHELLKKALNLINRQQAENDRLESVLIGVMHFVDKWLNGAELEQDEVNRASAMREKTLQLVEQKQAEIERLKQEYDFTREYIHDNGLEWDLLSKYISRNGG